MQGRPLRSGFTTGTCGAAAAKASAVCLLAGEVRERIEIMTPKGIAADMAVEQDTGEGVWFKVCKDAGDDPDVTNGSWIYASVQLVGEKKKDIWYQSEDYPHLYLTGGEGIGIVTKPGLSCPVGKHAINPVPRQMIFQAVEEVCEALDCRRELLIQIKIPQGIKLAEKTFNPKLGIVGGISVLGTSGIVEPMSEQALLDTIRLEIHMKAAQQLRELILIPGNYGENFLKEQLKLPLGQAVKCSNFVADAMEMAAAEEIKNILFVGHLGKLIKVAGGVRNTHSRYGDRRMEILTECLKDTGEDLKYQILASNTTEDALALLREAGCMEAVMREAGERIYKNLTQWSHEKVKVEVVTFSNVYGILFKSQGVDDMIKRLAMEEI